MLHNKCNRINNSKLLRLHKLPKLLYHLLHKAKTNLVKLEICLDWLKLRKLRLTTISLLLELKMELKVMPQESLDSNGEQMMALKRKT